MTQIINEQFNVDNDFGALTVMTAGSGYSVTSANLRRSDPTPYAADPLVWGTCSADFTLTTRIAMPGSAHGPTTFWLYWRIQDSNNYRYTKFVYTPDYLTATHGRKVSGTFTDEVCAAPSLYINPANITTGRVIITLLVRGNTVVECTILDTTNNYGASVFNSAISSDLNTQTGVGLGFDSNQKHIENGGSTRSFSADYFLADDKMVYIFYPEYLSPGLRNIGGVNAGGSHTIVKGYQWNMTGGLLSSGSHTNNVAGNISFSGGSCAGGSHTVSKNSIITPTGGIVTGGTGPYGWVRYMTGGSSIGGSAIQTLSSSYSVQAKILAGGSGSAIREYMRGGSTVGGSAIVNQHFLLNSTNGGVSGGLVVTVIEKQYIPLSIGGSALVSGNSSYVMTGGITLAGRKYPGGYKFRQKIIIPANTFTKKTEFYLLVRMLPYEYTSDLEILIHDPSGNVVAHDIRQQCDNTGLVHYGFMADIINPSIDNYWYVYF